MAHYVFTYALYGQGETEEEAQKDAIENFINDPGEPIESREMDDDEV
jgi:hypothetical protein